MHTDRVAGFDHVTIRVADLDAATRFYATVLATLGHQPDPGEHFVEWGDFSIAAADAAHPPTRNLHVGFVAPSTDLVDAFWRAGVDAGYPDDGAPGPRPEYGPDYYGGFLRDPDGNSAEAVRSGAQKPGATIDHLWLRVADPDASAAFYALIAPFTGFERNPGNTDRAQFRGPGDVSFSVLAGEPRTEHVHLAFTSRDGDAGVDAFHRAAVEAGHPDHGAYVRDPAGFTVEVVEQHRG